jgi:16S rRNA processing protein RimM
VAAVGHVVSIIGMNLYCLGQGLLVVGKISSPYGVQGWLKIHSYTDPITNIIKYHPWSINQGDQCKQIRVLEARPHGRGIVAHIESINDRDAAARLSGQEIFIPPDQLPAPAKGEYYWRQLKGLQVINLEGCLLGLVDHLLETGANDVLVVKGDRERLIPYVLGDIVKHVDLDKREIQVDWAEDY